MMPLEKFVLVAVLVACVAAEPVKTDSYLDALSQSNGGTKFLKREGHYSPDFQPGYPDADYGKPYPYPDPHYGPSGPNYGPPKPVYGPPAYPQPQYGPPSHNYGPPPNYGPSSPDSFYGVPHALVGGLIDKIKFKLDLFTIGKIILKLVIFKKIVSLIAILCLLLFLPSLKHKVLGGGGGHDDSFRSIDGKSAADDRINNISEFVWDSIESFRGKQNSTTCSSTFCKGRWLLSYINKNLSYDRLTELYTRQYEK